MTTACGKGCSAAVCHLGVKAEALGCRWRQHEMLGKTGGQLQQHGGVYLHEQGSLCVAEAQDLVIGVEATCERVHTCQAGLSLLCHSLNLF